MFNRFVPAVLLALIFTVAARAAEGTAIYDEVENVDSFGSSSWSSDIESPARRLQAKGTVYFGEDLNGNHYENGTVEELTEWLNSEDMYADWSTSGAGLESQETFSAFADGDLTPLTTTNGATIIDENNLANIQAGSSQQGIYPIYGFPNVLRVERGTRLNITFDETVNGFGFFATDLLDKLTNRKVAVTTSNVDRSNRKRYLLKVTKGPLARGAIIFWGVTDLEGFQTVMIGNRKSDPFGMNFMSALAS